MPTYEWTRRFDAEWRRLRPEQQRAFMAAVARLVEGLRKGQLDPRLRVHRVQARQGTWELSWAADGRATFEYGAEHARGDPHVIWRRIGDHRILDEP